MFTHFVNNSPGNLLDHQILEIEVAHKQFNFAGLVKQVNVEKS